MLTSGTAFSVFLLLALAACSTDATGPTPSPRPKEPTADGQRFASGRVVGVVDGATIDVDIDGEVVRVHYLGIAVPVAGSSASGGPSLEERASQFNRFLVGDKTVQLERDDVESDGLGRLLRYVYADGEMVNLAILTSGYATVAESPPDFRHKTAFAIAEEGAKQEQRGFWSADTLRPDPDEAKEPFTGGTLPAPPDAQYAACDFSGTSEARIKGNVNARTKERIYHVPEGLLYATIEVNRDEGDRWFCTEEEAIAAGWQKSKH